MKKLALLIASLSLLSVGGCAKHYGSSSDSDAYGTAVEQGKLSDRVFFAFDSSSLDEASKMTLGKQAEVIKAHPDQKFLIEGHCDLRGTREYNIALGERRAHAAKMYLELLGVSSSQLTTVSYGKERPAVVGNDAEARAQNRRAVVVAR